MVHSDNDDDTATTSTVKKQLMPTKSILPAVSLSLNIIVLIPICCLILFFKDAAKFPYDGNTASRQILFSVYLAILLLSVALLIARSYLAPNNTAVGTLLTLQIVYKVLSVGFVTNPINPVKWSNLGIAFFSFLDDICHQK